MKNSSKLVSAAFAALVVTTTAQAVVVNPNQTVALSGTNFIGNGPLQGSLEASVSANFQGLDAFNNVIFTGTLLQDVWRESASNTITFYYQIINDSTSSTSITELSSSNFTGWNTDVEYLTDLGGTVAPVLASRDFSGSNVNFKFFNPPIGPGSVEPGMVSYGLMIRTNATDFTLGSTSLIDGGVANVQTYAPVPEPATLVILGSAAALAAARRRRNRA